MQKIRQVTQFLAAGVVIVAGIPLAVNQVRQMSGTAAANGRAQRSGELAATALKSKDLDLAVRAYTDALIAAPDRDDFRTALSEAQAAQILESDGAVTVRNVLRLTAMLNDTASNGKPDDTLLLALGRLHMFRGQKDAARRRYEEVLARNPTHARALMYLGDLQLKASEFDNAQASLRKAAELDPTLTLAKFALGQVYLARKEWNEALPWLETAAKELPQNAQAAVAHGRALAGQEQWAEATKALEHALALDPGLVSVHALLGDAYLNTRRIEAAVGSYRLAWEKNRDLESLRKIGRVYVQLGSLEAAAGVFSQIRDLSPEEPEAHMILGIAAEAGKQLEVAEGAWKRCVELAEGKEQWAIVGQKCADFLMSGALPKKKPKAKTRIM